jgi:predicted ABC-type transport system involved in lysophospholipase L1 biosynthesis ATPase subunit
MSVPKGGEALVRYQSVSKWYGQVSALMDVSLSVGAEVVGLVGRNGAGKSTLMKLAGGLLNPSLGEVRICGAVAGSRDANAVLGFSPDIEKLYDRCSGRQFVSWMLRLHGYSASAARARAAETLDELGLGAHMHRPIREYSKGMRQRVRLAQALAHRPRALLLDAADPRPVHFIGIAGAGMSAESGIATFRDALTGLWARFDPAELASEEGFRAQPQRVWDWYAERRVGVRRAEPNAGHHALAGFARRWPGTLVLVTQNVDDLHQRAGNADAIRLHGDILADRWLQACPRRSACSSSCQTRPPRPACAPACAQSPAPQRLRRPPRAQRQSAPCCQRALQRATLQPRTCRRRRGT